MDLNNPDEVAVWQRAAERESSAPRWVDDVTSDITSGSSSPMLASASGWRRLLRGPAPSPREQWTTARSLLGDALTPAEWDEAERLSRRPPGTGRPSSVRLVSGVGSDSDAIRWTDLIDLVLEADGAMRVRRFRRRYTGERRVHVEVLLDTRAEGLPATDLDPADLAAPGRQRQLDALWETVRHVVTAEALHVMSWPDHGRVPTDHDDDQGPNTVFSASVDDASWSVLVSGVGHVRVTRCTSPTRGPGTGNRDPR
ncbi:hypothetical protein [Curtobacterium sp. MCBA15_001]|uniref:hypothetical protein n=1 Tax=Curtobacterium sp. MCBA15_001 TaxID=1898731 RepID=UPI0008DC736A|nr:hypothetical protein [Curtobacterium sp. MCBA15_001]OIH95285.1 hypothetical protein BIU90_00800 [Curtobacterium sp. MCBA15_001]